MTRILVVYGSTDGQTQKVAHEMGTVLRRIGVETCVFQASSTTPGPEDYSGVIVAASLHAGRYQRNVRRWIKRHAAALRGKPGAFVSVCLMVRDPRDSAQAQLRAIMTGFLASCGWMPDFRKPVAGALLYTRYGWLKRWLMKRIVAKHGGDTDTSRDYEYTDWADVRAFAHEFVVSLSRATPPVSQKRAS